MKQKSPRQALNFILLYESHGFSYEDFKRLVGLSHLVKLYHDTCTVYGGK